MENHHQAKAVSILKKTFCVRLKRMYHSRKIKFSLVWNLHQSEILQFLNLWYHTKYNFVTKLSALCKCVCVLLYFLRQVFCHSMTRTNMTWGIASAVEPFSLNQHQKPITMHWKTCAISNFLLKYLLDQNNKTETPSFSIKIWQWIQFIIWMANGLLLLTITWLESKKTDTTAVWKVTSSCRFLELCQVLGWTCEEFDNDLKFKKKTTELFCAHKAKVINYF